MLKYTDYDIVFQEIPNEVTLAISLSNCPHRCIGCHSPHLRKNIGQELNKSSLSELLEKYSKSISCVCFMGGDAAPKDVEFLSNFIKKQYKLKTGWYSGCDKISEEVSVENFDFIKIGGYNYELGGLNSKTTNQRLYKIENKGLVNITYKMWR